MAKSGIKQFLTEIFSWWGGQTWGTRLWIWRFGDYVGSDEFGNKYYQDKKADRRYVTYNGYADASTIGDGWHGWMHYRTDVPPSHDTYTARAWQKPHVKNLTGTSAAYLPDGSLLNKGERPRVTGDYDALVARIGAGDLHHAVSLTSRFIKTLAPIVALAFCSFAMPGQAQPIANPVATFAGLDKITGRITKFDVYINETVLFGALEITPRACYSRPSTETQRVSAFLEVDQRSLTGTSKRIFTGWMFADSPALNAVDHAVYDVWLIECRTSTDVPPPDTR